MKVIIAGSRTITNLACVTRVMATFSHPIDEVVSGGASGIDALGEQWARNRAIPVKVFPADWGKHGRAAGPIRNRAMAKYADALVAIWDGKSSGTKHMIDVATQNRLVVHVVDLSLSKQLPLL